MTCSSGHVVRRFPSARPGRRRARCSGGICAALGGLEGFTVEDRHQKADFLRAELRELAGSEPAEALRAAQSLAPGLPQVALACVDAVFDVVAGEDALGLCPTAMAVCARVPDFELGWPHQLAIARTFYAHRQTNDEDTEIQEGLTHVYQRCPSTRVATTHRSWLTCKSF